MLGFESSSARAATAGAIGAIVMGYRTDSRRVETRGDSADTRLGDGADVCARAIMGETSATATGTVSEKMEVRIITAAPARWCWAAVPPGADRWSSALASTVPACHRSLCRYGNPAASRR